MNSFSVVALSSLYLLKELVKLMLSITFIIFADIIKLIKFIGEGSWYTGNTLPWHGRVGGSIPLESTRLTEN